MSIKKAELLGLFRCLTPENRDNLHIWVNLAHFTENSALKSSDFGVSPVKSEKKFHKTRKKST